MSKELSYLEAIREALAEEMRRDPRVFVLGEDVGAYGGAFGVTQGLYDEFGEPRDAARRERPPEGGHPRRTPGRLVRAQVSLSPREGSCAGRRRDRADRRCRNAPRGRRHHADYLRRDGDAVARSGGSAGDGR